MIDRAWYFAQQEEHANGETEIDEDQKDRRTTGTSRTPQDSVENSNKKRSHGYILFVCEQTRQDRSRSYKSQAAIVQTVECRKAASI